MTDRTILHRQPEAPRASTAPWFRDASDLSLERFKPTVDVVYPAALEKYPDLAGKTYADAKKWLQETRAEYTKTIKSSEVDLDKVKESYERLKAMLDWAEEMPVMERPTELNFRKMRKAFAEGDVDLVSGEWGKKIENIEFEKEVFRYAEVFIVEHDWASAFESANIQQDVVKLPYDVCAFEFKFSGRPIIALATQFETDIVITLATKQDNYWMLSDGVHSVFDGSQVKKYDSFLSLWKMISNNIIAISVALDSEVARAEIKREPHTSEHGSNNYQISKPYRVVCLAKRSVMPLNPSEGESGHRVRLHFRRGHWRHLPSHKVWIKWMLVGDPDLGFVDKHYRL